MRNFKNYRVWHQAMDLVRKVYSESNSMPENETYGLTRQIRRSAISIPSNIAEGSGRASDKEFSRFIEIALGSSFELETQLILANDLYHLHEEASLTKSLWELQRGLNALLQTLKAKTTG